MQMRAKVVSFVVLVAAIAAGAYLYSKAGGGEPAVNGQPSESQADITDEVGSRASVAEQSGVLVRKPALEEADSLSAVLVESLALAEGGDPRAAKRAAEILQYCWAINADPGRWDQHMKEQGDRAPESRGLIEAAYARKRDRCAGVMGGDPYEESLAGDLLSKAGAAGDVGALVKLSVQSGDVPSGESSTLLESVVASGDPNDIRDAGILINFLGAEAGDRFQPLANSELGSQAWQVASCRQGASCGAGSVVMDGICMSTGRCGFSDYEAFVRSQWVPQGRSVEFERLVRIAESIINGD